MTRLATPAPSKPADSDAHQALHQTIGGSTKYHVGTLAVRTRHRAWASNPSCVECGEHVGEPDQCGLVITPAGDRIACRDACYITAILALATCGAVRHTAGGTPQ